MALDARGRLQPVQLCAALLRRPQELFGLARMARRFSVARRALDCALKHAGPSLLTPALATQSA